MVIKLKKAISHYALVVVLLLTFAISAYAEDNTPRLVLDDELKLIMLKDENFLEFENIIHNQGMSQSIIMENKNEKESEFYLQLTQSDVNSKVNIKDRNFISNFINEDVKMKIEDENDKVIYNETTIKVLHNVQTHKLIKLASLKQNESKKFKITLCSNKTFDKKYSDYTSQYKWRVIVKQNNKTIGIIDNNMNSKDISQEKLMITGINNTGNIYNFMVYFCVGVVVVGSFSAVYITKSGKYNSLPKE